MNILPVHMCICTMCVVGSYRGQKRASASLVLELMDLRPKSNYVLNRLVVSLAPVLVGLLPDCRVGSAHMIWSEPVSRTCFSGSIKPSCPALELQGSPYHSASLREESRNAVLWSALSDGFVVNRMASRFCLQIIVSNQLSFSPFINLSVAAMMENKI